MTKELFAANWWAGSRPETDPPAPTEAILVRLYEKMFANGARAGKSRRPEVRDAHWACAALVAEECLRLGYLHPDKTLMERNRGA